MKLKPKKACNHSEIKNKTRLNKCIEITEKITIHFNNILHKISSMILLFMMLLTIADVSGRYFFNKPITGTYELTGLLLAITVFFSLGKAQLMNNHIEIDVITNKFSYKIQKILQSCISFMVIILLVLMTWQLYEYSYRLYRSEELSGDLGLPVYIFSAITIIGGIAFTLTYLLDFLQSLVKVVTWNDS